MRVLVVNTGSSSLKASVLDGPVILGARVVERWEGDECLDPLRELLDETGPVDAVGHRVVHGGARYCRPTRIDPEVVRELASLTELAPLHQPQALAAISTVGQLLPKVAAVACFDTAFHSTMSPAAYTYALPAAWNEKWGLRRYGFHGLSHAYAARRAVEIAGLSAEPTRMVSCHLGAGASLCAVVGGISVDTTMGFTPLAGLVMETRSGSVDPGVLLWLLQAGRISVDELAVALEQHSGLAGLSGTSGDLRDVLAARAAGDTAAGLAYDVFLHRLAREVGAMVVSCGGLDLLSLTGGIGEHSAVLRADLAGRLKHLSVALDPVANDLASGDCDISAVDAAARTVVITAGEDKQIACEVRECLLGERAVSESP